MSVIRLATCNNAIEANSIKNILENEGIESFLTNENFTTLLPGYEGMLGTGIQVMINEEDFEQATKLINNQNQNEEIVCPKCQSTNVVFALGQNKWKKIIVALISTLFVIPFNNIKGSYYCKDCKSDFKI